MGFYDEMAEIASEVLSEFKQGTISLITRAAPTGNAWNPTPGAETTITLDAVANGISARYLSTGLYVASDKVVISAVPSVVPKITDAVLIDGVRYNILAVETKPEAGTPVVYVMICRRGG